MMELAERESYLREIYAPYFICSYTMHHFNLMNQKRKIFYESKRLPNSRMHILFVSPAGYMKSYYLGQMAGDEYGIFNNSGAIVGYEQSMSEPAFVGTINNYNGVRQVTEGAAETYKNGFLLIDEFSGVTEAMKSQQNSQMDSQLLAALDHGNVVKRLASGKHEYKTNLTTWGGVQPARYDLTSGLGRRFFYLLFIPTAKDNIELMRAQRRAQNCPPDIIEMKKLWNRNKKSVEEMNMIKRVEFCDDVTEYYVKNHFFNFEAQIFDKLALSYTIAKHGSAEKIEVSLDDPGLIKIIDQQKEWRTKISEGVDYSIIENTVTSLGGTVSMRDLVTECVMFGWNASQVHKTVGEMVNFSMLNRNGTLVTLNGNKKVSKREVSTVQEIL